MNYFPNFLYLIRTGVNNSEKLETILLDHKKGFVSYSFFYYITFTALASSNYIFFSVGLSPLKGTISIAVAILVAKLSTQVDSVPAKR